MTKKRSMLHRQKPLNNSSHKIFFSFLPFRKNDWLTGSRMNYVHLTSLVDEGLNRGICVEVLRICVDYLILERHEWDTRRNKEKFKYDSKKDAIIMRSGLKLFGRNDPRSWAYAFSKHSLVFAPLQWKFEITVNGGLQYESNKKSNFVFQCGVCQPATLKPFAITCQTHPFDAANLGFLINFTTSDGDVHDSLSLKEHYNATATTFVITTTLLIPKIQPPTTQYQSLVADLLFDIEIHEAFTSWTTDRYTIQENDRVNGTQSIKMQIFLKDMDTTGDLHRHLLGYHPFVSTFGYSPYSPMFKILPSDQPITQ
jgi:hypothetical protein